MKKILVLTVWLVLCIANLSFAQLLIEEGKVNLTVDPDDSVVGSITVHNTSDAPITVRAYWEDFEYQPPYQGKKNFLPAGSTSNSMSDWIQFSPRDFPLAPYSKKEIKYSIKTPPEIKGGHYGVLFIEKAVEGTKERVGVNIVTRVGSLFFLEPVNKERKAHLSKISTDQSNLKGSITNDGDIIVIPHGVFYTMGSDGLVVDRGEIANYYLPPTKDAAFELTTAQDLAPGKYTMVLTFDLGEGQPLVKEIDFEKASGANLKILEERD